MMKKVNEHLIVALASPHLTQLCEKLLKHLAAQQIISHLVINDELAIDASLFSLANFNYDNKNIAATIASGSFKTVGIIILGYSEALLFEIYSGITKTLIARAADVALKERRRLVYVIEKTPWNVDMVEQLQYLTDLGGIIFPLVPAFYTIPESMEEMTHHACARMMDLFGFEIPTKRWLNK